MASGIPTIKITPSTVTTTDSTASDTPTVKPTVSAVTNIDSLASDISMIKPAEFGGYGRLPGPEETYGGLRDLEFSSRCPPDVQPETRIIAVCGIDDVADTASPAKDGWFFSDFYLFHYLFRNAGANQLWMTCLNPGSLVNKYKEYAHGNRLGVRRIVLDHAMLPDVLSPGNIRVVPTAILCERFLSTVRSECRIAKKHNQPVLLLVFGHGNEETFGINIGGKQLTIDAIKQAIGRGVDVGILLTSCFSGGWVIKPQLNVTAMAAAGPNATSESWAKSESTGRASGSIYASAVLEALIKMEDPGTTQQQVSASDFDMEEDFRSSSTYAELSRIIYRTLIDDVDTMGEVHDIRFSAQDDAWETEWRPRSGIPLYTYRERWEMLRSIPVDIADPITNRNPLARRTQLGTNEGIPVAMSREGLRGSSVASTVVKSMAKEYLSSFPGKDSSAPNSHCHNMCRMLVSGKLEEDMLESLFDILTYRLSAMRTATSYKNFLSLPIQDCHLHDPDTWRGNTILASRQKGATTNARLKHYHKVRSLVAEFRIFEPALPGQSWTYPKPRDYLAIGLCESGMTLAEIKEALMKLKALKLATVTHMSAKAQRNGSIRTLAAKLIEKCGSLRRRVGEDCYKQSA